MAQNHPGKIYFRYHEVSFRIADATAHKALIGAVMATEGQHFSEITYIFCSDAYLLQLNKQFLAHDTYTDILTFTMSLPSTSLISEIYISIERVKENALLHNEPFQTELRRVMIHGALHLCGYEDAAPAEKAIMRQKEGQYLAIY